MIDFERERNREANIATGVAVLVGAVGFASAAVPAVEQTITIGLISAAALAVLVTVGRLVARRVRERREDREDTLTAVAWRVQHVPHLLTTTAQPPRDEGRAA